MFIPSQHGLKESELICYDRYYGMQSTMMQGVLVEKGIGFRFYMDNRRAPAWKIAMLAGIHQHTLENRMRRGASLEIATQTTKYKEWLNGS